MTLEAFNAAPAEQAEAALLACCASRRFAAALAAGRPYDSTAAAERAVDRVFATLTWPDVLEALDEHPRIGARVAGTSAAEQSGVTDDSRAELAAGNAAYEQRFGYVFLICASGLSGEQMLGALRQRLAHDEAAERAVTIGELRKITLLRMRKALAA
jgi:2-oxo-4-hydroxy-4-carboxy-5-ureidoimidazoline decarboxylase